MHQDPHVLNHGRPGEGPRLVPGHGARHRADDHAWARPRTVELADGWTVVTRDGSVAAHVEHTVALLDDGVWVLTAPDGGRARLGDLVTARQPAPRASWPTPLSEVVPDAPRGDATARDRGPG